MLATLRCVLVHRMWAARAEMSVFLPSAARTVMCVGLGKYWYETEFKLSVLKYSLQIPRNQK
jgi:hypothetical protein